MHQKFRESFEYVTASLRSVAVYEGKFFPFILRKKCFNQNGPAMTTTLKSRRMIICNALIWFIEHDFDIKHINLCIDCVKKC